MSQQYKKDGSLKELWLGIGLAVGLYLVGFLLMFTGALSGFFFIYLFIAPIAFMILTIVVFAKGRTRLGQGLLIGLGVDILLFAACFGILISGVGF